MDSISNLKLIEEMLYTAKKEVRDNGVFFMFWGWLVLVAALGQVAMTFIFPDTHMFKLTSWLNVDREGFTWLFLMPIGGIVSIFISRRQSKEEKVRTWFDDVMKYLWIAFGAVLGITLFMMGYINVNLFPIVIALYGLGLFITGGVLKFRPLIIGGISSWVLAVVAIFATDFYIALILALAVLIGYIIPGHMLQNQWKQSKNV